LDNELIFEGNAGGDFEGKLRKNGEFLYKKRLKTLVGFKSLKFAFVKLNQNS
jgi:hypothetical protein